MQVVLIRDRKFNTRSVNYKLTYTLEILLITSENEIKSVESDSRSHMFLNVCVCALFVV